MCFFLGAEGFENDFRKMSMDGMNVCRVIPQFGAMYLITSTVFLRIQSVQLHEKQI